MVPTALLETSSEGRLCNSPITQTPCDTHETSGDGGKEKQLVTSTKCARQKRMVRKKITILRGQQPASWTYSVYQHHIMYICVFVCVHVHV
jgi:hypothetical protein